MKSSKLLLIAAVAVLLAACSNKPTAVTDGETANVERVKSNFDFLRKLGIDSIQKVEFISLYDGSKEVPEGIFLDDEQSAALLSEVFPFLKNTEGMNVDEGEVPDGAFFIAGVKALQNDYTMVAFTVEVGDVAIGSLGIYDKNGKLTDYMDLGPWNLNRSWDSGMSAITCDINSACIEFTANDAFSVKKVDGQYEGHSEPKKSAAQSEQPDTLVKDKDLWLMERRFSYKIDDKGRIALIDVKNEKMENVPPAILLEREIDDISEYPYSDQSVYDKLNAMAAQPKYVNPGAEGDYTGTCTLRTMQSALARMYDRNPQNALNWMAAHLDAPLIKVWKSVIGEGFVSKEKLVSDIDKMTNETAKKAVGQLTAQWGLNGAMG